MNFLQLQNHRLRSIGSDEAPQLPPLPLPPSSTYVGGSGINSMAMGSIKPGSMSDRARLAKIPQPEAALKCPRCESSNTKFCYFNNYSLSQPRHFCKTCRRYWTRGGALRNVPVGGGCRRNKKNKRNSNRSKTSNAASTNTTDHQRQTGLVVQNSSTSPIPNTEIIGNLQQQTGVVQNSSFLASIQNLSRFGVGGGNMGLNLSEIQQNENDMGFEINGSNSISSLMLPSGDQVDLWRFQQFPFLASFDSSTNSYPFQYQSIEGNTESESQLRTLISSRVSNIGAPIIKDEVNQIGLNLSSRPNNGSENNMFWDGSGNWTDLSGLNSSSTNHLL